MHLVGGAIAVLDAAQQTVRLLALPFHVQHHVHYMLQDPWACYLARLQSPHGGQSARRCVTKAAAACTARIDTSRAIDNSPETSCVHLADVTFPSRGRQC